ncbi:MAG: transposase [Pirellulales bacterium]|nr:transposase [Pirellulales bacterium]
MPRQARRIVGGYIYHVLNRANGRQRLFKKDADFTAFENVVAEAREHVPLRILGYTVMRNHWHFVVWPKQGKHEQVSEFFRWMTATHSQRWHSQHDTTGMGHLYQGRFKSFPISADEHLLAVLRYVERNALRAGLVNKAEAWRWSSLYRRLHGSPEERALLTESPVPLGRLWTKHVNNPEPEAELAAIRRSVVRGQPFGGEQWTKRVTRLMGLEHTFRPRGRPRLQPLAVPAI